MAAELRREHDDLSAMVGFVGEHVEQHFGADWPGSRPSVSEKMLDWIVASAERFGEHVCAAGGAFGQLRAGLLRGAVRPVEQRRHVEMRSVEPHPLAANIVHVGENGRDGAGVAGWFRFPGERVEMFDDRLIEAIVRGKHLNSNLA